MDQTESASGLPRQHKYETSAELLQAINQAPMNAISYCTTNQYSELHILGVLRESDTGDDFSDNELEALLMGIERGYQHPKFNGASWDIPIGIATWAGYEYNCFATRAEALAALLMGILHEAHYDGRENLNVRIG